MGGPKLWTPVDQKRVEILRSNLLRVITSWGSYKVPILVKIGQRGFSRHIREIYTLRGIFSLFFFAVLELGYSPHRWTDFHAEYVKRRVSG